MNIHTFLIIQFVVVSNYFLFVLIWNRDLLPLMLNMMGHEHVDQHPTPIHPYIHIHIFIHTYISISSMKFIHTCTYKHTYAWDIHRYRSLDTCTHNMYIHTFIHTHNITYPLPFNSTRIGKRPCNSAIRSDGFTE